MTVINLERHHASSPSPDRLIREHQSSPPLLAAAELMMDCLGATQSDQRCPINGLHAKMKSNTGVQRGHRSPFIYFFYEIVPDNICLCPPRSPPHL